MKHADASSLLLTPLGCDTFVAFPPATPAGFVVFGKNSDRPAGERQSITRYPGAASRRSMNSEDNNMVLQCTYISIPQVAKTYAVLLSQIDWMWGAEMGANECGVVIGNEAVWTKVPRTQDKRLLGMDLVRLGLERGATALEARNVMTALLEEHGQAGPCAENDPSFTYHNSFLIADYKEAWVLETAGQYFWVAERITQGTRNISNGLTIRDKFDACSKDLKERAKSEGYWDGQEPFDFAKCFSEGGVDESPFSRQGCGKRLLEKYTSGTFNRDEMIKILRDHDSGICMHDGGFETTASMVSVIQQSDGSKATHWMTGRPHPCQCEFLEQDVVEARPC